MHVTQSTATEVSINLGGRQRNVTEQLLNGPQVGSTFEKVRSERMPQGVRRDVQSRGRRNEVPLHHPSNSARRESAAQPVQEQGLVVVLSRVVRRVPQDRPTAAEVGRDTLAGSTV